MSLESTVQLPPAFPPCSKKSTPHPIILIHHTVFRSEPVHLASSVTDSGKSSRHASNESSAAPSVPTQPLS
jgi:hypothetical protein